MRKIVSQTYWTMKWIQESVGIIRDHNELNQNENKGQIKQTRIQD